MSIIGYAAALGRFLEIHPFLQGLAQGLDGNEGPELRLSKKLYAELERTPDPTDPTEKVAEYSQAWWTWHEQWETKPPTLVDRWAGLAYHIKKVSVFRMCSHIVDQARCSVWQDSIAVHSGSPCRDSSEGDTRVQLPGLQRPTHGSSGREQKILRRRPDSAADP